MKKIILTSVLIIMSVAIYAQQATATISWDKVVHDFGDFNENDGKQKVRFTFTNTGEVPLYLTNVRATCGCTSSEYSREPIQPGATGFVEAEYDPKNRPGKFNKSITVTANTEPRVSVLRIQGNVIRDAM